MDYVSKKVPYVRKNALKFVCRNNLTGISHVSDIFHLCFQLYTVFVKTSTSTLLPCLPVLVSGIAFSSSYILSPILVNS